MTIGVVFPIPFLSALAASQNVFGCLPGPEFMESMKAAVKLAFAQDVACRTAARANVNLTLAAASWACDAVLYQVLAVFRASMSGSSTSELASSQPGCHLCLLLQHTASAFLIAPWRAAYLFCSV
jgi:hypothetical protein